MVNSEDSPRSNIKYVYTVSSIEDLVNQAVVSIKSLINFVDPNNIIVFFTPPSEQKDIEVLQNLGVNVRQVDHYALAMPKVSGGSKRYFADKLHLCSIKSKSVVFLDADTIVLDDPKTIVTEADLKARPGNLSYSNPEWKKIATKHGVNILSWMPNTGVLAFNNGSHQTIEQKWKKSLYFGSESNKQWTEQHALAVAASELDVDKLSKIEHVMLWRDEYPFDGVVYHTGDKWQTQKADSIFTKLYRRIKFYFGI